MTIEGDEADHAVAVKRLAPGEPVELLDGIGGVASARVELARPRRGKHPAALVVVVSACGRVERQGPPVHLCSATPKGDRLAGMIDQLSQVGAWSWRPLATARGVVEPQDAKLDRQARIAAAAGKQCGRAHFLELGPPVSLEAALAERASKQATVLLADASGVSPRLALPPAFPPPHGPHAPHAPSPVVILIGPEGGWTPDELALARERSAPIVNFGLHAMRIETAALVAAAIIIEHLRPR